MPAPTYKIHPIKRAVEVTKFSHCRVFDEILQAL